VMAIVGSFPTSILPFLVVIDTTSLPRGRRGRRTNMPQLDEFLLTAEPSMQRRRANFNGVTQLWHVASDSMRRAAIYSNHRLPPPPLNNCRTRELTLLGASRN
jgi:hypothetical protein